MKYGVIAALLCAICVAFAALADGPGGIKTFIEWKDVCFPHEMHFSDLEIECKTCHHETNAAKLKTPHKEYFKDFWIKCEICHKPKGEPATSTSCGTCHHDTPMSLADESLSSKVVIHESCWQCHEVGTGANASGECGFCHNGKHHHPTSAEGQAGTGES